MVENLGGRRSNAPAARYLAKAAKPKLGVLCPATLTLSHFLTLHHQIKIFYPDTSLPPQLPTSSKRCRLRQHLYQNS